MSYTPTAGIITAIEYQGDGAFGGSDCTLLLTVQSEDQGLVHILLPPGGYDMVMGYLEVFLCRIRRRPESLRPLNIRGTGPLEGLTARCF